MFAIGLPSVEGKSREITIPLPGLRLSAADGNTCQRK
jgi:hypothetical protein